MNQDRRFLRVTLLVCSFSLAFAPVRAYSDAEHIQLTNLSWTLAYLSLTESEQAVVQEQFDDVLALAQGEGTFTLGFINRAVDCYSNPSKKALRPPTGTELLDPNYFKPLQKRCEGWFLSGLAKQVNSSHFQEGATRHYLTEHSAALRFARSGESKRAVVHEMLAQHYLQDFMAPGHLVSDRETNLGTVSGHRHDHFNDVGLTAHVDLRDWADFDFGAEELRAVVIDALGLDAETLELAASRRPVHQRGDGYLGESQDVASTIALIAASSIREVLQALASSEVSGQMALCFSPRFQVSEPGKWKRLLTFKRRQATTVPFRAEVRSGVEFSEYVGWDQGFLCPDSSKVLWEATDPERVDGPSEDLYDPTQVISFMTEHVDTSESDGLFFGVSYLFDSSRSHFKQSDLDEGTYAQYPSPAVRDAVTSHGIGIGYSNWSDHESFYVFTDHWAKPWSFGPVDLTLELQGGAQLLQVDGSIPVRPWLGFKLGTGVSVGYLTAGARREYVPKPDGSIDDDTVVSFGVRLAATPGWIRHKVFRRKLE